MCGRYLTPDESALERHFGVPAPGDYFNSFNVAPTQRAPVVLLLGGERRAQMLTWGLQPAWAKRSWINARAETVFASGAFADAARERRCLVAAAGWYEWQGNQAPKQPFVHYAPQFEPIALAGIWTLSSHRGEPRRTFAILTRAATAELAWVHDRMPAVLAPEHYAAWLGRDTSRGDLQQLLRQVPAKIETRPVSTYVNKPANDGPDCIEPLKGPAAMRHENPSA